MSLSTGINLSDSFGLNCLELFLADNISISFQWVFDSIVLVDLMNILHHITIIDQNYRVLLELRR